MLKYLLLLLNLVRASVRGRETLVTENLLLRHQLAVLTRPTRKRPQLRTRDKLFWVVIRALRRDWRRHLVLARERHPLASPGVAPLLTLALARADRSATIETGAKPATDEFGKLWDAGQISRSGDGLQTLRVRLEGLLAERQAA